MCNEKIPARPTGGVEPFRRRPTFGLPQGPTRAYLGSTWLARPKGLIAFIALLTAHILVLVAYLRAADGFPNLFFLIFSPVEAALLGFLVGLASGGIGRRKRPNGRPPQARSPQDTT